MYKRFFIICVAITIPLLSFSQQIFFSHYSIEEGLSQSVVNCMFQDSKGFIWIGTQNGLNKFNGYSFEIYTLNPTDTNTISNNWIYSIHEDHEGNLWIGTKGGLNKFIRNEKKFQRLYYKTGFQYDLSVYPYDALVARNGDILINTPPVLTIFNPKKETFSHYTSALEYDGAVKEIHTPIMEDSDGLIWVASTRGLASFNLNTKKFTYYLQNQKNNNSISDNMTTALYQDKKGNIWVGTERGLNVYNNTTGIFKKYFNDPKDEFSLSSNVIRTIIEDKSGNMWIGTEGGGLNKMSVSKEGKTVFERIKSENSSLSHNIVLDLIIDKSENLWAGTLQGISKTDLKKQKFVLYRKSDPPHSIDLLGNVIASIYKDDNGIIWIGNWGQGLNLFNRKTGKVEHFSSLLSGNHYLPNDFVHVIYEDKDKHVWIGTRDGILIYNKNKHCFNRLTEYFANAKLPDFLGVRIYMIIQDRNRNYWIGTQSGLYKINIANATSERYSLEAPADKRISANLVYSMLEDRDGQIWIATVNGLDVYSPTTKHIRHYHQIKGLANSLCDNFVISLCEDHHGDIWIGTSSYVNKFVKKDSSFVYYSQQNGLPNNRIFEIAEDNNTNLWFATGGGLSRLDTITNTFRTYSVEEGLQSLEFNLRACYKSKDGEMFFGGMNGFNSFYPDALNDNSYIPPIAFTSFYKTKSGINEFIYLENTPDVRLNYNDYSFTIEFAALEFTNPQKNRYAYMMEGISDEWIDIGNRHFITFSSLPAGTYVFKVKCSNNDGLWNESWKSLKIVIMPPWWKSKIAYGAYILIVILLVIIYTRLRVKKLIKQRKFLEEKVRLRTLQIEKQKTEILGKNKELINLNKELAGINATKDRFFSIIAHDLRNPFNSIIGLADIVLYNFHNYDSEKIKKSISDIKDASKQAHELLQNLLLWSRSQTGSMGFQAVGFDLNSIIIENMELLKSQANKKNIQLISSVKDNYTVSGDMNMIDTILRNLLTNAIKFTPQNGRIFIAANEMQNHHEISVKDTGVGITPENISKLFRIDIKYSTKGTEMERGSGIGLILCKEFVEKHSGKIWVESQQEKGSEFKFTLPKQM